MKRQLLNKVIEIASIYWGFDFFHLLEAGEALIFNVVSIFKNKKNENENQ